VLQTENAGWTSGHTRAWGCRESGTVPADPTTQDLTQDDEEETDNDNVHHDLSRLHLLVCMENNPFHRRWKVHRAKNKSRSAPGLDASSSPREAKLSLSAKCVPTTWRTFHLWWKGLIASKAYEFLSLRITGWTFFRSRLL
jgi:hypothetical protein